MIAHSRSWRKTSVLRRCKRAVGTASKPPVLVAHSLACLLVAHWQLVSTAPVTGAFLVAVPNPQSEAFPAEATSFANPPLSKF